MRLEQPLLSVIVPAYNGTGVLPRALSALAASDLPRSCWELIVVDDGSTDNTAQLAAGWADVVLRIPGRPHGPAYARNRGVETAGGEVVVFVDADVVVHPDTLRRFAWAFASDPALGAVFGSYDDRPHAPGVVSRYRNLLHHWHHQQNAGEAETFWAGCGAVRRNVFNAAGKFDEWHYRKPSIEDVELGHRIHAAGFRILLRPEIQCTHLKQWSLWNVVKTDVQDRGIPWMRLLLQEGKLDQRTSLNLKRIEKVNTAMVGLALLGFLLAIVLWDPRWLGLTPGGVGFVGVANLRFYRFLARSGGLGFVVGAFVLHLLYYVLNGICASTGWLLHHVVGEPAPEAAVQAWAEVGVRRWPPVPTRVHSGPWGSQ